MKHWQSVLATFCFVLALIGITVLVFGLVSFESAVR